LIIVITLVIAVIKFNDAELFGSGEHGIAIKDGYHFATFSIVAN